MNSVCSELRDTLKKCLNKELEPEDTEITVLDGNKRGTGYLGNLTFITVKNKKTLQEDHLVIKKQITAEYESVQNLVEGSYSNEIYFYTKIWPTMKRFQEKFPAADQLDILPKFYGACNEAGKQQLVLENLKLRDYQVLSVTEPLKEDWYEKIFELFAKYHALSFAMRHYEPQTLEDLVEPLQDNWLKTLSIEIYEANGRRVANCYKAVLDKANRPELLNKIKSFIAHPGKDLINSLKYNGKNSVIKHGDSWINNMLIKFNDANEIEDIKLIDFQMCYKGTLIDDLSHCFYSSADRGMLKNLKKILKCYHDNFSQALKSYNLNAEEIYPFDELLKEWKECARFGFVISLFLLDAKYKDEQEVLDLGGSELPENTVFVKPEFAKSAIDLIEHYYENDFQ